MNALTKPAAVLVGEMVEIPRQRKYSRLSRETIARLAPCPKCGMGLYQQCVRPSGEASYPHRLRVKAALIEARLIDAKKRT